MIDERCSTRDWDGLLRVRDRARHAVDTGRQLWPAATLAEYRLALLAPPPIVAAVLDESDGLSGRFTIGPLTEVAAQDHTWADLAPVLDRGPRAAFVAQERVLRGEIIADDRRPPGGARTPSRDPAVGAGVLARGLHRRRGGVPDARPVRRLDRDHTHPARNDSTMTSTSPSASSSNRGWRARTVISTSPASRATWQPRSARSESVAPEWRARPGRRRWPGSPGPARVAAPTVAGEARRRVGSARGGCWRRSAT